MFVRREFYQDQVLICIFQHIENTIHTKIAVPGLSVVFVIYVHTLNANLKTWMLQDCFGVPYQCKSTTAF